VGAEDKKLNLKLERKVEKLAKLLSETEERYI